VHRVAEEIVLSATDLANHLSCTHLTELDRLVVEGQLQKPYRKDPTLEVLIERGNVHEKSYVDALRAKGKSVVEIQEFGGQRSAAKTADAIRAGVDVIVQAALADGRWQGRPDLLMRVDAPSDLGNWSYQVADTKLAQNTRAGTVLQLCLYSEMLAKLQGLEPTFMEVVRPGAPFEIEQLRFAEFAAYYRLVKRRLEERVATGPNEDTYPEPVMHCDVCRWWTRCNKQRRDDDHLTFVAGIQKLQINELNRQDVRTLTAFASSDEPLPSRPERGSLDAYQRVHRQAKIQLAGRLSKKPEYEFLDLEENRGFVKLPGPDAGDIFFDIEGDPHAAGGPLEYLLGYVLRAQPAPTYHCIWALDRMSEKAAFEQFIDFVMDRWTQFPGMHVYHYAPYEPSAVKRLSTRYATREAEVDRLLRGQRFVDLYAVVRQGIRASVEGYSIKNMEAFYGYKRLEELESARYALRRLERALELGLPTEIFEDDKNVVAKYNEDDCISTLELQTWLETISGDLIAQGKRVPRPELKAGEASQEVEDRTERVALAFADLVRDVPVENRTQDEQARWLLAHMLDYFRREDKCVWWEFFRFHELEHEELLVERDAISGLKFESEVPGSPRARTKTHRYRFEPQEVSFEGGETLYEVMGDQIGTVANIELADGIVDIRKRQDSVDVHPHAVFTHTYFNPEPMPESLLSFADTVIQAHKEGHHLQNARYDLLAKRPPLLKTLALPLDGPAQQAAVQLVFDLDQSVLAIQGPPGTGKTHVGSEMIAALAKAGRRVGVTAVSHKVIGNLLGKVLDRAGDTVRVAHRVSKNNDALAKGCKQLKGTPDVLEAIQARNVVGGTSWVWSRPELEGILDYLFIDEAGQMSLAMALAAGRAAKNIVLLGDPQQLEQPQKGSHPEGAEIAALKHLLDGRETISSNRGLFLDETWRLHPGICEFTTEQYYDRRLRSRIGLERQLIRGPSTLAEHQLAYVAVRHSGNQSRADEEVAVVSNLIGDLLAREHAWTDSTGTEVAIQLKDILVVAPYNAQVAQLRRALPDGARVGTVDKFQGQEAPVVVYSLTSSSVEEAPRGMEFLFSPNRLNVATSRARCLAIVVGSPKLFEPECKTPMQMQWANGFCRYLELATLIS
jgi:predicted RecB family nuclease